MAALTAAWACLQRRSLSAAIQGPPKGGNLQHPQSSFQTAYCRNRLSQASTCHRGQPSAFICSSLQTLYLLNFLPTNTQGCMCVHAYLPVRTSQKSLANSPLPPIKYLTGMEDQHHFLENCNGIINRVFVNNWAFEQILKQRNVHMMMRIWGSFLR